jgi:imidazolonepropionase-like amidohydrolase
VLLAIAGIPGAWGQTTAITDVTVINPRTRSVLPHHTVIVERDRIIEIRLSSREPPLAPGTRLISGKQKFLIPGLWDAHVHLTKAGVLSLPLFVANGVTGVRDMGSDFREVAAWRSQIEAGTLIGPRIKTSGQMLESRANVERMKREGTVEPVDRLRIGVANAAEGRAAVARLIREGVDHIKMRTTPDLETFLAVGDEAKRRGLPFAAHPVAAPDELLRAGLGSVEHFLAFPPVGGTLEERRALFQKMARSKLFLSDTRVNLDALISLPYSEVKRRVNDTAGTLDPRRKYVCGYLIADWREQAEELKDPDTIAAYGSLRKQLPEMQRNLREMRAAGVEFLAGTDVAVLLMYPGFSLHDELRKLVLDAGFTPMDVLRIATSNVAAFYGQAEQFGAIEVGDAADLVLLDSDPLADIQNTRTIRGVMARGRWFNRAALNTLLREVEQAAGSGCHDLRASPN